MGGQAVGLVLSERQQAVLEALVRATSTSQQMAVRCRVVLRSALGERNDHQAASLGVDRQRVRRWRRRWSAARERLDAAEQSDTDADLIAVVEEVLADSKRCGGPTKFTPEQVTRIIALACEVPKDSGVPTSRWTPAEIAREAVHRGIVDSISERQVDRFLARRP